MNRTEQSNFFTNTDIHKQIYRHTQKHADITRQFHLKKMLAFPSPSLSPYCTSLCLCSGAQQSLMCTDTPNSGHMVRDK